MKITFKRLIKFLEALPLIAEYIKRVWEVIKSVINEENEKVLESVKKEG